MDIVHSFLVSHLPVLVIQWLLQPLQSFFLCMAEMLVVLRLVVV